MTIIGNSSQTYEARYYLLILKVYKMSERKESFPLVQSTLGKNNILA